MIGAKVEEVVVKMDYLKILLEAKGYAVVDDNRIKKVMDSIEHDLWIDADKE